MYLYSIYLKSAINQAGANKRRLSGVMMRFTLMRHDNRPPRRNGEGKIFFVDQGKYWSVSIDRLYLHLNYHVFPKKINNIVIICNTCNF